MTKSELLTCALSLPVQDRAALAHDLIASLDAEEADPRGETFWAAEIARRLREVLEGKADVIDSDAYVRAKIERGLRDVEAERVVEQSEAKQRFAKWLGR